jgi:hypothetical protein
MEVTLAVRNPDAGQRVAAQIVATSGNTHVGVAALDLAASHRWHRLLRSGMGRWTFWSTTPA